MILNELEDGRKQKAAFRPMHVLPKGEITVSILRELVRGARELPLCPVIWWHGGVIQLHYSGARRGYQLQVVHETSQSVPRIQWHARMHAALCHSHFAMPPSPHISTLHHPPYLICSAFCRNYNIFPLASPPPLKTGYETGLSTFAALTCVGNMPNHQQHTNVAATQKVESRLAESTQVEV
ncbi:hypothetical protein C8R44DRAFT_754577 [Mycena epipterygia]|nr:hypothetical protein C8R44DRAFT_754577 [Mycena epipterygia]